jgi:hypothetical protein
MIGVGSVLYGDYGSSGIWQYSGSGWTKLTGRNPSFLATYDGKLVATFPGNGIYEYDGSWNRITKNDTAQGMCGVGTSLYVDFDATGLYQYDASRWNRITRSNCEDMVAADLP